MINKHPFAVAMLVHLLKDLFDVQTPQDLEEFKRLADVFVHIGYDDDASSDTVDEEDAELFAKAVIVYELLELGSQLDNEESREIIAKIDEMFDDEGEFESYKQAALLHKAVTSALQERDIDDAEEEDDDLFDIPEFLRQGSDDNNEEEEEDETDSVQRAVALFKWLEELSLGVESKEPVNVPSFSPMQSDDEDDDTEDDAQDDNAPGIAVEVAQTRGKGFDFQRFIESLDNNDEKREIIEKYKEHVGIDLRQIERIEELPLYKDYLTHFDTEGIKLFAPEYLDDEFDLDLLLRLAVGSFSSTWAFEFIDESDTARLLIRVSAGDRHVDKYLDALWGFQIARMYEIYIEEQLNLEILRFEDEKEAAIVESQRQQQLEKYDEQLARYRKHTMLLALQGGDA